MVTTYIAPDTSDIGRLQSLLWVVAWQYDEDGIHSPRMQQLHRRHRVPTWFLRKGAHISDNIITPYKHQLREDWQAKAKRLAQSKQRDSQSKAEQIYAFLERLDEEVSIERVYERGKYEIYHLVTPFLGKQHQRAFVPSDFLTASPYNSKSRQAEVALGFPFSILDPQERTPRGRASLEALVQAPGMAVDFETQDWQTIHMRGELVDCDEAELRGRYERLLSRMNREDEITEWMDKDDYIRGIERLVNEMRNERITTAGAVTAKRGYLISTLPAADDEIDVQMPGGSASRRFSVVQVRDQHELMERLNSIVREEDPFYIYGHNHMTFDYRKAQETCGNLRIGVAEMSPKREAGIPGNFIERRVAPGRMDVDGALFAQQFMWLMNNKLDTVYLHSTGRSSPKSMNHDELAEKTAHAEDGSREDTREILYYAAQDVLKSYCIGEELKRSVLLMAQASSTSTARVLSTGQKSLSADYWAWSTFRRKGTLPKQDIQSERLQLTEALQEMGMKAHRFDDFDSSDFFYRLLSRKAHVSLKAKRGWYSAVLFALFPYLSAFEDMIGSEDHREQLEPMYKRIQQSPHPSERCWLAKHLQSILDYPLLKLIGSQDTPEDERTFAAAFNQGFSGDVVRTYKRKVWHNVRTIAEALGDSRILNYNSRLLLLEDNPGVRERLYRLQDQTLGAVLGEGTAVSGTRGRFAFSTDKEVILEGIADPDSNKGERCDFERNIYHMCINSVLKGGDAARFLDYCDSEIKKLHAGKVSGESLVYERTAGRDFHDYSAAARQGYISKLQEQKARHGDLCRYQYTDDELMRKFFNKGSIDTIVEFVFPARKNSSRHQALQRLYQGKADEADRERILYAE